MTKDFVTRKRRIYGTPKTKQKNDTFGKICIAFSVLSICYYAVAIGASFIN